jgi:uncharacterized protein (UPF0332 family)
MSFNWTEFLTLAEALASDPSSPGPPEAALRSAASRAYYAAFHCAFNIARQEGFVPKYSGDDHKGVQVHFRKNGPADRVRRKIAKDLGRLYDHRRKADYSDTLGKRPESLANHAIGMARNVLSQLNSL